MPRTARRRTDQAAPRERRSAGQRTVPSTPFCSLSKRRSPSYTLSASSLPLLPLALLGALCLSFGGGSGRVGWGAHAWDYGFNPYPRGNSSAHPRMATLFSVECNRYFDWQTVGIMHSYRWARLGAGRYTHHRSSRTSLIRG